MSASIFYDDAKVAIDWLSKAFGFEVQLKSKAPTATLRTPSCGWAKRC
jgi:hypothetical protein